MKTLIFSKPHHLGQLHDELLAAVPGCAAIIRADGEREAVCRVEGRDDGFIRISFPDNVDEAEITTVVETHVPDPQYGLEKRITSDDVMKMNDPELRQWLTRRLL